MAESETEQRVETEAPAASGVTLAQMLATVKGPTLADMMRSVDVWPPAWLSKPSGLEVLQRTLASTALGLPRDLISTETIRALSQMAEFTAGNSLRAFQDTARRELQTVLESLYTWPATQPQPRRLPYTPERPPEPIEVVQVDSQITLEGLGRALAEGRLPVRDVMRLCLRHVPGSKPGVKEPPIEEQLALVEGWYSSRGGMLQEVYCGKVGISRATLHRYEKTCKALGLL